MTTQKTTPEDPSADEARTADEPADQAAAHLSGDVEGGAGTAQVLAPDPLSTLPNYVADVTAAAQRYPAAWACAHTGTACTEDFIKRLAADLHQQDPNVGLNGKRGNDQDLSDDALAIYTPSGAVVDRTGRRMDIIDVIAGAGGPTPQPAWQVVGGPSPGAWVQPSAITPIPVPVPRPTPMTRPYRPYDGDEVWQAVTVVLEQDYRRAGRVGLDGRCGGWIARTIHDAYMGEGPPPHPVLTLRESITKRRPEWCLALGIPVA